MSKMHSTDEFRDAISGKTDIDRENIAVFRLATAQAQEVDGAARTLRYCFSDDSVDRAGDRIEPDGWELGAFLENPVALWAHMSCDPPIGNASNVSVVGNKLMGDIAFAAPEDYAFADTVYRLSKKGFIRAVSVGFKPLEWSFTNDKQRPFGIDFTRQELLEISVCPVPCNANALMEARAAGINVTPLREWAEKILDGEGGKVTLSRTTLEEIFKATNTPHAARARYRSLVDRSEVESAEDKAGIEKAGRRISKDNIDRLTQAVDHIKAVIDSNAQSEDPQEDDPQDAPDGGGPQDIEHQAAAPAPSAKERALKLLKETRELQSRDDNPA